MIDLREIDQAEVALRERIAFLSNEASDLREWLRRRRDIVKSTADKLFDVERRLAALRQQLADYQMAKVAAKERGGKEAAETELVSVEIVGMRLSMQDGGRRNGCQSRYPANFGVRWLTRSIEAIPPSVWPSNSASPAHSPTA